MSRCAVELKPVAVTIPFESDIVITPEAKSGFHENIVERKTIVYETLVDPAVIKIAAENIKEQLFTKYIFLRPRPDEVTVLSIEKTYEPFILTTGRYSIDYYRKRTFTFKVDNAVSEVVFGFGRFSSKQITDSYGKTHKGIEIVAEERLQIETETTLTLDALGKETSLRQLSAAPSEKDPGEILAKIGEKQVAPDLEVKVVRNKIQKRPADIAWIENEAFDVTERIVIYTPRFHAMCRHNRTGRKRVAEFDGVTGKLIRTYDARPSE
jgi:hypothetical protein